MNSLTDNAILKDLCFDIQKNSLTIITGNTGSGKTSLLHLLMAELPITSGKIQISCSGTFSYAPQEAWIFPGSLQDNILFYSAMDENRFRTVLKICALDKDIEQFENGKDTLLDEKGIRLSSGQKTRIG